MKIHVLNTGNFKLDGGAMFGVVPKAIWSKTNPADKNNYIKDIPRTFSYLGKVSARYDFLQPLSEFIRFYNLQ